MISPYVVPGLKSKIQNLKRIVQIADIITSVTDYYNMDITILRTKGRNRTLVQARYVLCYLLRKHTAMSLIEIAQYLAPGITDHTTVIHGVREIKAQLSLKHDNEVKTILNEIYI